jgi:hypothetical protein
VASAFSSHVAESRRICSLMAKIVTRAAAAVGAGHPQLCHHYFQCHCCYLQCIQAASSAPKPVLSGLLLLLVPPGSEILPKLMQQLLCAYPSVCGSS